MFQRNLRAKLQQKREKHLYFVERVKKKERYEPSDLIRLSPSYLIKTTIPVSPAVGPFNESLRQKEKEKKKKKDLSAT